MNKSESTEYTISATVRGEAKSWSYDDHAKAMLVWDRLEATRVIPGTADAATDLVLRAGEKVLNKLGEPYPGLAVP